MSRLSLKTLKLKSLPFGMFTFKVLLKRETNRLTHCDSNAGSIEQMRNMLRTTCLGSYRLRHKNNYRKKRVYTELLLTNAMDLAMIKLVHADKLHKIYKIKVDTDGSE